MIGETERLHKEHLDKGYRYISRNGYRVFVDDNDEYVSPPHGYITGPFFDNSNGTPRPWYVSVNSPDGWHQRSGVDPSELKSWAIDKQSEILAMGETE